MDVLLPQNEKEFADPKYWKRFFEHNTNFEWYGDYTNLSPIFEKYIRPTDAILQIGCGNSTLAEELFDNGFRNIVSIDTDSNVIARQNRRNSSRRPTLKFENCSASKIHFLSANSINVVLDKGTLDALLPTESTANEEEIVECMFEEVERCLLPFGRYIIVTLAQQHIITKLIQHFGTSQFMVRLHKCELKNGDSNFIMPVFVVIITKLKTALEKQQKFEFSDGIDSQAERVDSTDILFEKIKEAQQMSWFKHYITCRGPVEETTIRIYTKTGQERYELIIVDASEVKTLCKYGVFIVPFGRESDWLFATPKGRTILRKNCDLHRLVVVRLSRTQQYTSLDQIQNELDPVINDFRPKACAGQRINYLSLGSMDVRESVELGNSEISGNWTVEHVSIDGHMYRRLVFLDSQNLVQSEVRVKCDSRGKWQIDWANKPLTCEHHQHMLVALEMVCNQEGQPIGAAAALSAELRIAVLGLGGGILVKVLHDILSQSTIYGVELDPDVAQIATKHFDFPVDSERIRTEICDALEFLNRIGASEDVNEKFDILFVDLSGPVDENGLYCPPPKFVTEEVLKSMKDSLRTGGVLTINFVTRDETITANAKKLLSGIFASIYSMQGDEDINEVVFCSSVPSNNFTNLDRPARKKKNRKSSAKQPRKGTEDPAISKWLRECLQEVENIRQYNNA